MGLMNSVFREYLDKFVIVFLDDIFFYYKLEKEHEKHLCLSFSGIERTSVICQTKQV
jgi:hypothetical protein